MRPQNQTLMALIIAFVMSIGFIGVYAVDYEFTHNGISEIVYQSDSNLEFNAFTPVATEYDNVEPLGIGTYKKTSTGVWYKNNCTPVYTGNLTWQSSMIGFASTTPLYATAYHYVPIKVSSAKTFIANSIFINISLPSELVLLDIALGGYDEPQSLTEPPGVKILNQNPISTGSYSNEFTLSAYEKLAWYNSAQNVDNPVIDIRIYDDFATRDGLANFALDFNITIYGQTITTWSMQDSVNVIIGVSIGINCVIAAYMTDAIDFDGYRKDLRKRGFGKRKR